MSCGHSEIELRTLTPRAAVTVSDELGRATRKSNKEREKRAPEITYSQWMELVHNDEQKAIPPDDPIFRFADDAGISDELLYLAWRWFGQRYREDDSKRYRDWRAVFRRAVREDWHKCWRQDYSSGQLVLTTVGLQLQKQLESEERREAA
jgi:hypothetical protein